MGAHISYNFYHQKKKQGIHYNYKEKNVLSSVSRFGGNELWIQAHSFKDSQGSPEEDCMLTLYLAIIYKSISALVTLSLSVQQCPLRNDPLLCEATQAWESPY